MESQPIHEIMSSKNDFYRQYYPYFLWALMALIVLTMAAVGFVVNQILHRPLPQFTAIQPNNEQMTLTPFTTPNLLAPTVIRWATKAATAAYTFDFANYQTEVLTAKPYFTDDGWKDYLRSVNVLFKTIVQNQLFVSSVVAGTPIVSNQGDLPGKGYTWRLQIPFLVTYVSSNTIVSNKYLVMLTVVRVPTSQNPQGVGVDQFVMVSR